MPKLIEIISTDAHRMIVDTTGFTDKFDVHLEFTSDEVLGNGAAPSPPGDSGLSILDALQQQLGLRLTSTRLPVEVLVIDHVERPPAN